MAADMTKARSGWASDPRSEMVVGQSKAIRCGLMLDVKNQKVLEDVTIRTEGQRIVDVTQGPASVDDVDAVIDLSDQVCGPGLMDMHVHFTGAFIRAGETHRPEDPYHYAASEMAIGLDHARRMLYSGVTTARSMGEFLPHQAGLYLQEIIDKGAMPAPRLYMASGQIGYEYGSALAIEAGEEYYQPRRRSPGVTYDLTAPGDDVRAAVRRVLQYGGEWVKVSVDNEGIAMPARPIFGLEDLTSMADEAHKWGKRITGHVIGPDNVRNCVLAGFDAVEHAYTPTRSTLELMKERNVYWSNTLVDLDFAFDETDPLLGEDARAIFNPDMNVDELVAARDEAVMYAYEIGVPIVYSSDGWNNPGEHRGRMVLEFSNYLQLGVTPWDVLEFATMNPARMLGQEENLGSIEPGKFADIVAFPSNPLDDVVAYKDVNFVMKAGNIYRDDHHRSPLKDVFVAQIADVAYVKGDDGQIDCVGTDCPE